MRWPVLLAATLFLSGCEWVGLDSTTRPAAPERPTPNVSDSTRARAIMLAADNAERMGNLEAAERDYLQAAALSGDGIDAHLALARLYEKRLETGKARAMLEAALERQPNHALANYLLGKLYLESHEYAKAEEAFLTGLATKPEDLDLSAGIGVARDMQGRHAEAQEMYLKALRANPKAGLANLRTNLAMSYLLSNQPAKAIEVLEPEMKNPRASTVTRHNLALAYGLMGRDRDAKALLKGEVDEDTRLLMVARLKQYIRERDADRLPEVLGTGLIKDAPKATDAEKPKAKKQASAAAMVAEPDPNAPDFVPAY